VSEGTHRRATQAFYRGGKLTAADGRSAQIGAEPVTVGRSPAAQLTIEDREVSALHCALVAGKNGVVLRDLGSTNGTFIAGLGVREVVLVAAATIRLGQSELSFEPASGRTLLPSAEGRTGFGGLVGASPRMLRLYDLLEKVAPTDLGVLITGETGTGKELVARAIHAHSARKAGPFVVIDCGALPASLAESTLFGHERGAFTGAIAKSEGAFQAAHGGTVFLDELGELPDEVQPKLLRAVAERSVKPVGASKYVPVDVRVLAATRRDLRRAMNAQRFREDLYFRIAQTRVELPTLRERAEDIPALVAHACAAVGAPASADRVNEYVRARFQSYDWPGNVRELCNVARVLAAIGEGASADILPVEGAPAAGDGEAIGFLDARRRFEEGYFRRLLGDTDGNISEIARRCGLARHQVRAHLKKLGIVR
jgi:DNA-binding NtrC family response regulator